MPRRKTLPMIPDYTDNGRNPENHIVQKSNPLLTLSETELTLPELKILDAYLSRINSHAPEKRFIRLEKGKIEELLGVTQIKSGDLEKRIDSLFKPVTIRDENKSKGFTKISLFEKAECYQDSDGLWQIDLGASVSAMKYIFNPENLGYLRYRLANVINLTSRYSYILYLYLERERYRKSWEIPLVDLKSILRCTADTYSQFKRLNDLILKKCQKELNEKTNLRFSYEPIKKSRSVRAIRFTIETLPALNVPDLNQITFDNSESDNDDIGFLQGACCPFGKQEPEFTRVEMEQIFEILTCVPRSKLPPDPTTGTDDIRFRQYHYLSICYAKMNRAAEKTKIKNRFSYFCKILKGDAEMEG